MALNLVSPGVRIREVDLTVGGITAANNQVGAIAGPFQKGPVDVPILIETENDLLNTFGKPISSDAQYEYWLGASSYLSYGGVLRVVRCNGTNLNNANAVGVGTSSVTLKIKSTEDYNNSYTTATDWAWSARNPGSWANNLKVCVIDAAADQRIAIGTFGLTVGCAVTSSFSQSVAGVGIVTTETGVLKGIITKVNAGSIDVKVTAKSSGSGSTVFTETSYLEGSVNAFGAGNIKIVDNNGAFVKIEESTILRFFGVVAAGSTVINPVNSSTQLPSPIAGQFIAPVTGSSLANNTTFTVGIGTTINGVSQTALGLSTAANGTGTVEFVVLNVAGIGETITAPSDWYNEQTLGLSNSTVYWRNIAPRPRTSEYASQRNGRNDELHVVVIDDTGEVTGTAGNILEKYTNVSKAYDAKISPSEANYYKDIVAANSQYIFPGFAPTGVDTKFSTVSGVGSATDTAWGLAAQGNTFNCIGAITYSLTGGKDYSGTNYVGGYSVGLSDVISGYRNFTNPAEYKIDFLIGGPSGGASIQESQAKANELIAIADIRKDCVATISPHRSDVVNVANSDTQTNSIVKFFDPLTSSSYAVFDTGYKYIYDRFNNQFRYVACNADVAGLMARTSINQYPWFSPAGASRGALNNAVKLAYNPSQAQRDLLYPKRINPIIFSPGAGIILFGDKTALSYTSAFDRINVRRLFLTLESSIERAARAQLFEFNDTITRANFINIVEPYLRDVKSKRGITDFVLVCDESNNTPDVIDGNQFKADIYIKPARSINFIGLTFVATRTGVSFEEIIGTV